MIPELAEIKELLEIKHDLYNRSSFIEGDPVSIPHRFSRKEDIEISGFLTASISWGQRKTILSSADTLLRLLDCSPLDFLTHFEDKDLNVFRKYVHRTFNGEDCIFFLRSLKNIYARHGGLEQAFSGHGDDMREAITGFRKIFFSIPHPDRTVKHVADPTTGASAKRINMFLRWMVRKDKRGVDFGIWNAFRPSKLYCPLDVHTGDVARKLGLIRRRQNDWKALEELMAVLREFDPEDPVKYDFALFGLGMFEEF